MNIEFFQNDNCPPGYDDEGTRIKGGTRKGDYSERRWIYSMKNWPRTINEAEAQMNVIRQNPKAYDFEQGE